MAITVSATMIDEWDISKKSVIDKSYTFTELSDLEHFLSYNRSWIKEITLKGKIKLNR